MHNPLPITRELLLIGGGHTHALVLRMWGMNPLPGVRLSVINPMPTAPYSGMLPGFVAGHYTRDQLNIDLVRLARFAGARLIAGWASNIDPQAKTVTLSDGRQLSYDVASVDVGITSDMKELPGFGEHAVPAKPLDRFAACWDQFRNDATSGKATVIGGGIAGVELAMAMAFALGNRADVTLIERHNILPGMSISHIDFFKNAMEQAGITVLENTTITKLTDGHITLSDGANVSADFVVGAAGTRPHGWLKDCDLPLENGYIRVDKNLCVPGLDGLFATGDCAHMDPSPRPKAGVFAVRQAPILFKNLRGALSGGSLSKFDPQKDYLKLISMGGKSAFADKWGIKASGPMLWRLKNKIDIKFMKQFQNLKPMPSPKIKGQVALGVADILAGAPLCGGCGAKVGGQALGAALAGLPSVARGDILSGPGDDAAILRGPERGFQVISTDHLRAFTNDTSAMARIAAIHALGDVWAMGAQPQSALANITLPRLSPRLQADWLAEIMAAAGDVFSAEGAAIIGGHTSQGSELCIGFTVTGLRQTPPITKAGAKPGDLLLLTKPIGTGVILAAEMALQARGDWVINALNSMARPQGKVADFLGGVAHGMTDITGFGLAGHLMEIAKASSVGISLDLAKIPVLPGALALSEAGVRSSLYEQNRALLPGLDLPDTAAAHLIFDPQTAGGLLATASPDDVSDIINNIKALGADITVIGHCTDAPPNLRLI